MAWRVSPAGTGWAVTLPRPPAFRGCASNTLASLPDGWGAMWFSSDRWNKSDILMALPDSALAPQSASSPLQGLADVSCKGLSNYSRLIQSPWHRVSSAPGA